MTQRVLIHTPSVPHYFAQRVAKGAGLRLVSYQHTVFSCGELFSKPRESLRGKAATVLFTFNPQTASQDAVRLLIMHDGLRRMDVKGVDFVGLHFPKAADLAPLFSGIRSLMMIGIPYDDIVLRGESKALIRQPAIDLIREGLIIQPGIPLTNISALPLFEDYFTTVGQRLVTSSLETYRMINEMGLSQGLKQEAAWQAGKTAIRFDLSKSGKKVVAARLQGDPVVGMPVSLIDYKITSWDKLARGLDLLGASGATGVHVAVAHAIFGSAIRRELEQNDLVKAVVTTDTIGIPGEKWLVNGAVKSQTQAPLLPKMRVFSTIGLVTKALLEKFRLQGG